MPKVKTNSTKLKHMCVVLAVIIIFHFLPPVGELTKAGVQVIGIFLAGLYGWIFVDLLMPSIVCLIAVGTTEAISLTEFFINGIGSQNMMVVLGILFLSAYIIDNDLSGVTMNWAMSRKISVGKPYMLLLMLCFATYLLSIVSMALVAILLVIPLFKKIMEQLKLEKYSEICHMYFCGIALSACMGELSMPFKSFILLIMGLITDLGIDVGHMTAFLLPVSVTVIILYVLFCKFILRIDASACSLTESQLNEFKVEATKKQKIGLSFIAILLVALLLPSFTPQEFILNKLGSGGIVLALLAVMMLIPLDGEPLLDLRKVGKDVNWDIFFNCAYFMPMGALLTSDVTGIKATISTLFRPFFSSLSPFVTVLAFVVISALVTQFLNNAIVAIVFISMINVLGDALTVKPAVCVVLISLAAFMSVATPAANAAIAILYTEKEVIDPKKLMIQGAKTIVFLILVTVTAFYGYANLIF